MNNNYTLELDSMKQCIGYEQRQVNAKSNTFKAEKNYYFLHKQCPMWFELANKGLAEYQPRIRGLSYHLTPKGAEYLGGILGVKIILPKAFNRP